MNKKDRLKQSVEYWKRAEKIEQVLDRAVSSDQATREIFFKIAENLISKQEKLNRKEGKSHTGGSC